jgi:hypothetical protein
VAVVNVEDGVELPHARGTWIRQHTDGAGALGPGAGTHADARLVTT